MSDAVSDNLASMAHLLDLASQDAVSPETLVDRLAQDLAELRSAAKVDAGLSGFVSALTSYEALPSQARIADLGRALVDLRAAILSRG